MEDLKTILTESIQKTYSGLSATLVEFEHFEFTSLGEHQEEFFFHSVDFFQKAHDEESTIYSPLFGIHRIGLDQLTEHCFSSLKNPREDFKLGFWEDFLTLAAGTAKLVSKDGGLHYRPPRRVHPDQEKDQNKKIRPNHKALGFRVDPDKDYSFYLL